MVLVQESWNKAIIIVVLTQTILFKVLFLVRCILPFQHYTRNHPNHRGEAKYLNFQLASRSYLEKKKDDEEQRRDRNRDACEIARDQMEFSTNEGYTQN